MAAGPQDFYMGEGDTKADLQVTLLDGADAAVDVSGSTVVFTMLNTRTRRRIVDRQSVTLVTAASGIVKYPWSAGDTDEPGEYLGEFEVTFSDSSIQTYPNNRADRLRIHIARQAA